MVGEHNKALDMDRTTIRFILSLGSSSSNNNSSSNINIGTTEDQLLQFMAENKTIRNVHEKIFVELENFQANTTVFQTNINATMRNLETQVGQLALSLQSQSKNTIPSSTEINPKDLTLTAIRGNDELQGRKTI